MLYKAELQTITFTCKYKDIFVMQLNLNGQDDGSLMHKKIHHNNASVLPAQFVQQLLAKHHIPQVYQPPYSPGMAKSFLPLPLN
jgi:hypothetical protein